MSIKHATRTGIFPERKWARLLRDSDLSPKAIGLGLLLATWANHETAEMRVSIPTLRTFCVNDRDRSVDKSTIIRWRQELVKAGYLKLVKKGDGRGNASVYSLKLPTDGNGHVRGRKTVAQTVPQTVALPSSETVALNATPSAGEVQCSSSEEHTYILEQPLGDAINEIKPTAARGEQSSPNAEVHHDEEQLRREYEYELAQSVPSPVKPAQSQQSSSPRPQKTDEGGAAQSTPRRSSSVEALERVVEWQAASEKHARELDEARDWWRRVFQETKGREATEDDDPKYESRFEYEQEASRLRRLAAGELEEVG